MLISAKSVTKLADKIEKREEICKKLNILYICVDNLQQFKDFMEYYFDISSL